MPRVCQIVRVFTRNGEGGNALGVINDTIGLDDDGMQAIAAELGFSETVFVDWPEDDLPSVRIFTPLVELPFAGHPLVGTAWTLLTMGPGGVAGLRCGIGDVAIGMDGDDAWITVTIDPAAARPTDLGDYAARAGLPVPLRSWLVAMPRDYVVLEYPDAATVAAVAPDAGVLGERFGTLVYARSGDTVRARFFAPSAGVLEDPATGSAAVALATALLAGGEVAGRLTIDQGEEIGHPSRIELAWDAGSARIGGGCVRDEVRFLET
jgi:trans-2,3-dihydro-3-hydroxyanthranilate isomerase